MSTSLIQIAQDSAALEELLQESGGELSETLETFLAEIETGLTTKADNYYSMMDHLGSTAERYRKRSEAYRAAAKSAENIVERMKDRIHAAMQIMGKTEVEGKTIRFKIQNSPASLKIAEGTVLPAEMTIVTVTPDAAKIKAALKSGDTVNGCRLEQGTHVRSYLRK
jgi:hypothetical protein